MAYASRKDELDLFKRQINLSEFAAAQGYALDRKASSRNSVAMKGPGGDKIIIARDDRSGHWIYFSVADEQDNGTIIDFVDHRERLNLGAIRKELRPWIGQGAGPEPRRPAPEAFQQEVEPIKKDLAAILAQFAAMVPLSAGHRYLEEERGVPRAVLESPLFSGRIYTDRYDNAVFPHHDRGGVCGFEVRNFEFRGFAKGGRKGLWYSNNGPEDTALIIAESAIDALSYHALHGAAQARYFSIAGEMNPMQRELLSGAMRKLPEGGTVVAATDNDAGGLHLAQAIREIAESTQRPDLGVIEHRPEVEKADWNDLLKTGLASAPRAGSRYEQRRPPRMKP